MEDVEIELLQADRMNGDLRNEIELLKLRIESKEECLNELQRSLIELQNDPMEAWRGGRIGRTVSGNGHLKRMGVAFLLGLMLGKRL